MSCLQRRIGHSVLYPGTGTQAIRIPLHTSREIVVQILRDLPPGEYNRRKRIIQALNRAGVKAS